MSFTSFSKDPAAVLDYAWDWTGWLADSETISSAAVTTPTGITKSTPETINAGRVTAWFSGGTEGQSYDVACAIITSQGRVDERTIRIRVTNR